MLEGTDLSIMRQKSVPSVPSLKNGGSLRFIASYIYIYFYRRGKKGQKGQDFEEVHIK